MDDKTARLFSALGVLVLVWIVVYWAWPVNEKPVVTSSLDEAPPLPASPAPPADVEPDTGEPTPTVPAADQDLTPTPTTPENDEPVVPPRFQNYTVRSGDNFEKIAKRVLGDPKYAMVIARANPLQDPSKLRVGQTIRIPLDPTNIQGRTKLTNESENETNAEPTPPTIEYTVRKGDTLSGIAKSFYGSIRYTNFLFNANKDRLRSEDDLKLGQVLLIPPLPTEARD